MASTRVVAALIAVAGATVALTVTGASQLPLPIVSCRHGVDSSGADRVRRAEALALARAIHAEQGRIAQQTRLYQPLDQLPQLPPTPDGFVVRLQTNGQSYLLSLKDTRDPCHYGIFSDQDGRLYEASPSLPQVAS